MIAMSTILFDTETFRLTSYGHGMAYALRHKANEMTLHVQGDDAAQFDNDLECASLANPKEGPEQWLRRLWCDHEYCLAAQRDDDVAA
jgi:hypothetical protein